MPRDLTARQLSMVFDATEGPDFYGQTQPAALQREAAAMVERATRRGRLRTLLADRKWHTTDELVRVAGSGVSSRLHELREGADGLPALVIDVERVPRSRGDGTWRYQLTGEVVPGRNLDGES